MQLKRKSFSTSLDSVKLGIASRKGSNATIKIPQIGWDNKPIDSDAVSEQSFVLESTGKNQVKIKGAFHRDSPLCAYFKNEPSKETADRRMPLPLVPIDSFDNIDEIPKEIRDKAKNGKIPNFKYVQKDENGNIIAEAQEVDGTWYKVEYAVPLYKQYFTETYELISDEKADGKDDNGNYVLTHSPYCYVSLCNVGFFNGHEVDSVGNKVKGTEGTYMVEGAIGENNFMRVQPLRSGARTTIGSRLNTVLAHPVFGVVSRDGISKSGYLKKGKFNYSGKAVHVAIYNSDGEVAAVLTDRAAYKVEPFVAKKTRASSEAEASEALKEEIKQEEVGDADIKEEILDSIDI